MIGVALYSCCDNVKHDVKWCLLAVNNHCGVLVMPILWRKEMSVDASTIDDDHKLLIDLINSFEAVINQNPTIAALDRHLLQLRHYSIEHFKREEALQRAVHYPFYQAHAREHSDLVNRLETIIAHRTAARSGRDLTVVSREILALLKEWLVEHILRTDLRMRPYVAQMKAHQRKMAALTDQGAEGVSLPPFP